MGDPASAQTYGVGYHAHDYKDAGDPYEKSPTRAQLVAQQQEETEKAHQGDQVSPVLPNPDLQILRRFIAPARHILSENDTMLPDLERGPDNPIDGAHIPANGANFSYSLDVECHHIMDSWGEKGTGDEHQFFLNSTKQKSATDKQTADGNVEWMYVLRFQRTCTC